MNVELEKVVTVKLTLTEDEAKWLRAVMQNPLAPEESTADREMRGAFFNRLNHPELMV